MSFLAVFAVAAVILPLLVLLSMRNGVLAAISSELRTDPRLLEVSVVGKGGYSPQDLAAITDWPEVGFLVPRTRFLASTVTLVADTGAGAARPCGHPRSDRDGRPAPAGPDAARFRGRDRGDRTGGRNAGGRSRRHRDRHCPIRGRRRRIGPWGPARRAARAAGHGSAARTARSAQGGLRAAPPSCATSRP